MKFKFFPWDRGENPYFVNNEGFEWYIDKETTKWCSRKLNNLKPLKAVCFYVKKEDFIERVLIDDKQNILHHDTSLEGMAVKIDMLRIIANE